MHTGYAATDMTGPDWLTSQQAADLIGTTDATLRWMRTTGRGPRYYKRGDHIKAPVRYRREDIDQWLRERDQSRRYVPVDPTP